MKNKQRGKTGKTLISKVTVLVLNFVETLLRKRADTEFLSNQTMLCFSK
jgi:hypothetical protein